MDNVVSGDSTPPHLDNNHKWVPTLMERLQPDSDALPHPPLAHFLSTLPFATRIDALARSLPHVELDREAALTAQSEPSRPRLGLCEDIPRRHSSLLACRGRGGLLELRCGCGEEGDEFGRGSWRGCRTRLEGL